MQRFMRTSGATPRGWSPSDRGPYGALFFLALLVVIVAAGALTRTASPRARCPVPATVAAPSAEATALVSAASTTPSPWLTMPPPRYQVPNAKKPFT